MIQSPATSDAGADPAVMIARMRWLLRLRWLAVAGIAGLGAIMQPAQATGGLAVSPGVWLWAVAAAMAVHNAGIWLLLRWYDGHTPGDPHRRLRRITRNTVVLDTVLWLAVLHFTGGAMNPLVGVLVFILAIAASLQSVRYSYWLAGAAGTLYAGLAAAEMFWPAFLPPRTGLSGAIGDLGPGAYKYVLAGSISAVVIATFFLVVYFTASILARLRRINIRLADANRQLSALEMTKSRFLRISSHQLRAPLAAIHSLLSAVREAGEFSDTQDKLVRKVHDRVQVAMKQLDEMLLLSTIKESGIETARRETLDVNRVLGEVVAAVADQARRKGLELTVDSQESVFISAWPDALEAVLENLISNAVKYTPASGRVSVRVRRIGRVVEIRVADTGIGIPPDQQSQVFGEFFRATNARQVSSGTGLGLSIVKATVERLGGEIRFQSALKQGTTISVTLPAGACPSRSGRSNATLGAAAAGLRRPDDEIERIADASTDSAQE